MDSQTPTKIACPSCGADLAVPPYGKILKCEYCGSRSTLPSGPPGAVGGEDGGSRITLVLVPEGRHWGGNQRLYALIGMGVLVVIMLSVFAWLLSYSSERTHKLVHPYGASPWGRGRLPGAGGLYVPSGRAGLGSTNPLVVDVDGDGVDDLIAWRRAAPSQGGGLHVVALDGKTFKIRWRGDDVGAGAGAGVPLLFRDEGTVLVSAGSALAALRVTNGEWRWAAAVPDRVERITKQGNTLRVTAINGKEVALRTDTGIVSAGEGSEDDDDDDASRAIEADGDLRPLSGGSDALLGLSPLVFDGLRVNRSYCPPGRLVRIHRRVSGSGADGERSGSTTRGRFELRGSQIVPRGGASHRSGRRGRRYASSRTLEYRCDAEVGLAWATQVEGSPVSFIVGYDREDGTEKWRLRLPPADSVTRLVQPPLVAFQGDLALVSFVQDPRTLMLRLVSLETGREVWHASASWKRGRRLMGLGLGRTRAFAHSGDHLVAFDAKTGLMTREGEIP